MTSLPRLLTIMGSGETTPTMSRIHRALLDRLGERPVPAVLLDTPYGFQENADDITARAQEYFRDSVGNPISVASFRGTTDDVGRELAAAAIREAAYAFSGPGSPTYALRVWQETPIPGLLAEKLRDGGAVTVASAAAVTIGRFTLPVYEVYKAGADPHWLPGLDLLAGVGLSATVVPHYDNAEGGTHDTRFCYMGEGRLRRLEAELPDDVFILGVDGHTALTFDLDAGTASVSGQGTVTVRRRRASVVFASGTVARIDELAAAAFGATPEMAPADGGAEPAAGSGGATGGSIRDRAASDLPHHPLAREVALAQSAFASALEERDARRATAELLGLESRLVEWSHDTEESAELDHARAAMRSMIARLAQAASDGTGDPADRVRPFVDFLIDLRLQARTNRDWATADTIRDRLVASGIELHDAPEGTTWELRSGDHARIG